MFLKSRRGAQSCQVVPQARPLKMEGPEEQTVLAVRGNAHVEWLSFGSGCKLKQHYSMADIMLNVHFAQDIGLIRISIQQIDFTDRVIGSEIEETLFSINRCT